MKNNFNGNLFAGEENEFEIYSDELSLVRKYRDEITMKMNNFCFQAFGIKPKISEYYTAFLSAPKVDDELFRWTVCCSGSVFVVSLLKKELVYWKSNSIFKEKHHTMPVDSDNPSESIDEFLECIACYRPNYNELQEDFSNSVECS